jgi:hypothetical protein
LFLVLFSHRLFVKMASIIVRHGNMVWPLRILLANMLMFAAAHATIDGIPSLISFRIPRDAMAKII